ncbi:hypothetical protein DHEL01_v200616 [Diaporthe helianthi]|uniref:Uncharacterized protein n=1 Tax=Diaporthe helianthi TaxID=158607 RepID=A0A2P5IES0_DIAHE|nr:hypothetical protein DHEL01_v200616 [Diaporthe helianthi]
MTPAFEVSSTTTPATVGLEKGEAAHLVPQASSPGQDPRRAPGQPTSRHRGNETESSEAEPYGSQACPVSGESHQHHQHKPPGYRCMQADIAYRRELQALAAIGCRRDRQPVAGFERPARHGDSGQLNHSAPKALPTNVTIHEAWFRDQGIYVSSNKEDYRPPAAAIGD